jgi:DNA-binding MarR family transcriptional regulator
VILDPLAARRAMISTALTDLERARHTSQQALYQLARAEGMSVSDIARACGVSRQLVSRSLKE